MGGETPFLSLFFYFHHYIYNLLTCSHPNARLRGSDKGERPNGDPLALRQTRNRQYQVSANAHHIFRPYSIS